MHIIEKWGTGIPRFFKEAADYGLREPELKDFGPSFRINLFRKPFETDPFGVVDPSKETIEGHKKAPGTMSLKMSLKMSPKAKTDWRKSFSLP